jgi:DNA repair protein RecO (recombination protein O)
MSQFKTDGIVLGSLRLTGADKLVTVLTHDLGKIVGAAAGVRRLKSRFGGALEPFSYCRLVLFRKRPDLLFRINQADILRSFQSVRENLGQIELASWMVNLIKDFTAEEIPNPGLFIHLLSCLKAVENKQTVNLLPVYFELHLLRHVGYQPRLDRCVKCQGAAPAKEGGRFLPSAGGMVCAQCKGDHSESLLSPGATALARHLLKIDLSVLGRLKPSSTQADEVKEMLKLYDHYLLEKKRHYPKLDKPGLRAAMNTFQSQKS